MNLEMENELTLTSFMVLLDLLSGIGCKNTCQFTSL
jgi:hypothetical protein